MSNSREAMAADLERRAAIMRKAARLDIAARLLASFDITSHDESPALALRRRRALEQADALIAENEVRP